MERLTNLLGYWNHSLPDKVDYADLVCSPDFTRGFRMVYEDEYGYVVEDTIKALEEFQHYKELAEQGRLMDIETYQQRLIRYIDAGRYRSADKKVFSENDVVYLIEHGVFQCESEAEQALERQG